jgi:hypothetical protein
MCAPPHSFSCEKKIYCKKVSETTPSHAVNTVIEANSNFHQNDKVHKCCVAELPAAGRKMSVTASNV